MIRVAQVIPQDVHPYSGLLVSASRLATWLSTEGYGVELWQFGDLSPDAEALIRVVEEAGVERVRLPRVKLASSLSKLEAAISGRDVDVAHLHGVFNTTNVRLASKLKVPYVITPHGGYASGSLAYHPLRKRAFRRLFELPMLENAGAVGALTEREANEIREFGVRGEVSVIPNGVDPPPADIDPLAFRREYGIPADSRLATYIGRIDVRAKRLDALIKAIVAAHDWHLAIVGGDFRRGVETLRRMIDDAGVSRRTWIVPPRRGARLQEVLAASDLFVLISRSEGMPMALLEASSWGVPAIVSTEVEDSMGVVKFGAGWCVDPSALGHTLVACAAEDAKLIAERRAAARRYAQQFDWSSVAHSYGRLYERVLQENGEDGKGLRKKGIRATQ